MAFLRAKVRGVRETQRSLRRIERKADNPSLQNAARLIAAEARRLAPRDSGRLRRSIRAQGSGQVGSRVRYAPYVEYGTRRRRYRDAQKFIEKAIDNRTHEIVSDIAKQIDDQVKAEGGKPFARGAVSGFRRGRR